MTLPTTLILLALTIPSGTPTWTQADVLREIDSRYQHGTIDEDQQHLYRVALVRDRDLLPEDLRSLSDAAEPSSRRSLSRVFHEAWRWVVLHGAQGGALHELLMPPDDLGNVLDSANWPIRVSYDSVNHHALAQQVLTAAEVSWNTQTNQYGFYEPVLEPGSERYRFYITSTGGSGAAYTTRYEENPDTPRTDCFTYIVVDPTNEQWSIDGTVAHEVNHSMAAAMDCIELITWYENTATYIMGRVFPQQAYYTLATMPYFQSSPWRALDYMNQYQSDLYEYGGGLFAWYLADTYAPNDGPMFLAEIWQATIQTVPYNEPDYYEAIVEAVAGRGGTDTIEDIVVDFSEARFFVGGMDDGAHITGADNFTDAEVTLARMHTQWDLPLVDAQVDESRRPAPFGSNHIFVDLPPDYPHPLRLSFDGDDDTRWRVRVLWLGPGPAFSEPLELDTTTWDGSLEVMPGGAEALLLLVVNLGTEDYDPDARQWPVADYTYGIEPVLAPPTLEALSPDVVERGSQDLELQLVGTGFSSGAVFDLYFDDDALQIQPGYDVEATAVTMTVTIPLYTELGPKTLTLVNGDGQQAVGVDFLTVVEHGTLDPGGDAGAGAGEPKEGCGCATEGGAGAPFALLLLGLASWLLRRRRRRI